jgi:hypothetical protein
MILPGMHKHIQAWGEALTARDRFTGALVHRIRDDMFTPTTRSNLTPTGRPSRASAGKCVPPCRTARMGQPNCQTCRRTACSLEGGYLRFLNTWPKQTEIWRPSRLQPV